MIEKYAAGCGLLDAAVVSDEARWITGDIIAVDGGSAL
jgi:hypothetical protein